LDISLFHFRSAGLQTALGLSRQIPMAPHAGAYGGCRLRVQR
jgi:hypothetical protein